MDEKDNPRDQGPLEASVESVLEEERTLPQRIENLERNESPKAAGSAEVLADGHALKVLNDEYGGLEAVLIEGEDKPSSSLPETPGTNKLHGFLDQDVGVSSALPMDTLRAGDIAQTARCEDPGKSVAPIVLDERASATKCVIQVKEDLGLSSLRSHAQKNTFNAESSELPALERTSYAVQSSVDNYGGNSNREESTSFVGEGLKRNKTSLNTAFHCAAVHNLSSNHDTDLIPGQGSNLEHRGKCETGNTDLMDVDHTPDVSTNVGFVSRIESEIMPKEHIKHTQQEKRLQGIVAPLVSMPSVGGNLQNETGYLKESATVQDCQREPDLSSGCSDLRVEQGSNVHSIQLMEGELTNAGLVCEDLLQESGAPNVSYQSPSVHSCQHKQDLPSSHGTDVDKYNVQTSTGAKVAEKSDSALLETEESALGSSKHEAEDVKAFEATNGERVSDEIDEEHFVEKLSKGEPNFGIGDLVWAKVKSHPWWPAQVFDSADASASAKKVHKSGRVLVAFFGDGTFGWLQQSQLVAFWQNFKEKVKQTTMKTFCKAVAEALDEVCRRAELGLRCSCHGGVLHSAGTFPDSNAGIQNGVRIKCHRDISLSKEMFNPEKTLEFIKSVACSPCGSWSSSLEASALRGQAYGFRTGISDIGRSNSDDLLLNVLTGLRGKAGQIASTPAKSSKLKRRFSSLQNNSVSAAENGKEAKKANIGRVDMQRKSVFESSCELLTVEMPTGMSEVQSHKESKDGTFLGNSKRALVMKEAEEGKKFRRGHSSGFERDSTETIMEKGAEDEKGAGDGAETLFSLAGFHSKILKKLGKGKLQGKSVKKGTDEKVGLGAQEVKLTESNLQLHESNERRDGTQAVSQSSLTDSGASNEAKASEVRTKIQSALKLNETKTCSATISIATETNEKLFDTNIIVKDKKKLQKAEKFPVPMPHPASMQDGTVNGTGTTKHVNQSSTTKAKKSLKTVKLGKCGQRLVRESTGTPSTKPVNRLSAVKAISKVPINSVLKDDKKCSTPELSEFLWCQTISSNESVNEDDVDTFVQLVQGLQSLARDPLSEASSKKNSSGVTEAFLKLRDIVFQKSEGYMSQFPRSSEQDVGKMDVQLDTLEHLSDSKRTAVMQHPCSLNVPSISDVQAAQLDKSDDLTDPILITLKSPCHAQQIRALAGQQGDLQDAQTDNSNCLGDSKMAASKSAPCAAEKHDVKDAQLNSNYLSDPKLTVLNSPPHSENPNKKDAVQTAELDKSNHLTDAQLLHSKPLPRLQNVATRRHKCHVQGTQLDDNRHLSDGKLKAVKSKHPFQNVASTSQSQNVAHTIGTASHSQDVTIQEHDVQDDQLGGSDHPGDLKPTVLNLQQHSENVAHASHGDVQDVELDVRDHLIDAKLRASKSQPQLQKVGSRSRKRDVQRAQLDIIDHIRDAKVRVGNSKPGSQNVALTSQIFDVQDVRLGKREHVSDPKLLVPKSQSCSHNVTVKTHKNDLQDARTGLKRKSEVIKEGLARLAKKSLSAALPQGKHAKSGTGTGKSTEQSHSGQHLKHHPRTVSTPELDVKSHMHHSDNRLSSQAPMGLFMKFPQSFALPSEAQLKATFIRFGALQTSGTRVYSKTASAQVVFKHGCDAERAFKYSKENTIFGQAAVTFRLRQFSTPEKSDTKQNTVSSGKENSSVRADERTPSLSVSRTEGQNSVASTLSLSRDEKGRTGFLAGFPASHHLQAIENPSNGDTALNLSSFVSNSASTVKDSSGDIQDQMIKLLRQVSVLVHSSNSPTEAT